MRIRKFREHSPRVFTTVCFTLLLLAMTTTRLGSSPELVGASVEWRRRTRQAGGNQAQEKGLPQCHV